MRSNGWDYIDSVVALTCVVSCDVLVWARVCLSAMCLHVVVGAQGSYADKLIWFGASEPLRGTQAYKLFVTKPRITVPERTNNLACCYLLNS